MADEQHSNEETSDYEFKLVTPTDAGQLASGSVVVGESIGWFKLKNILPGKGMPKWKTRQSISALSRRDWRDHR